MWYKEGPLPQQYLTREQEQRLALTLKRSFKHHGFLVYNLVPMGFPLAQSSLLPESIPRRLDVVVGHPLARNVLTRLQGLDNSLFQHWKLHEQRWPHLPVESSPQLSTLSDQDYLKAVTDILPLVTQSISRSKHPILTNELIQIHIIFVHIRSFVHSLMLFILFRFVLSFSSQS